MKKEVNIIFDFLTVFDDIEVHKQEKVLLPSQEELLLTREIQKTLRGTTYIILYNMIEFTVRGGILELYDEIKDAKVSLGNASKKIFDIWIKYQANKKTSSTKFLTEIVNMGIANNDIDLPDDSVYISGNLDYREIEKIKKNYGFNKNQGTNHSKQLRFALLTVKNKRNELAHGNITFSKVSEVKTIVELIEYKNFIIQYLDEFVDEVEYYINNKKYQK